MGSWNRIWQPTPVFFPEKFHGQRSLAGYSPWGHKESGTIEHSTATAKHGLTPWIDISLKKENTNQNHNEILSHICQDGYYQKNKRQVLVRVWRILHTADGNVKWCSHCGTVWQFLKKWNRTNICFSNSTSQHFPKRLEIRISEILAPLCSLQYYSQDVVKMQLSINQFQFQFSCSVVSDSLRPPWIAARQASLSITISRSSLRLTSIESVMPSSHLILCRPLLLLLPISPSTGSFPVSQLFTWGGQSTGISASASFPPKKSQGWSPSEWNGWISLQSKGLSKVFSNTTVQKHQFFGAQFSSQSNSHPYMTTGKTIALTRQTLVSKVISLLLNMLSRLVITFFPRSKCRADHGEGWPQFRVAATAMGP